MPRDAPGCWVKERKEAPVDALWAIISIAVVIVSLVIAGFVLFVEPFREHPTLRPH